MERSYDDGKSRLVEKVREDRGIGQWGEYEVLSRKFEHGWGGG